MYIYHCCFHCLTDYAMIIIVYDYYKSPGHPMTIKASTNTLMYLECESMLLHMCIHMYYKFTSIFRLTGESLAFHWLIASFKNSTVIK